MLLLLNDEQNEKENGFPSNEEFQREVEFCDIQISSSVGIVFKKYGLNLNGYRRTVSTLALLFTKLCKYENPKGVFFEDLAKELDPDILNLAENIMHIPEAWTLAKGSISSGETVLRQVAKNNWEEDEAETPESVWKLAEALLDIHPGEHFLDLCCGSGRVAAAVKHGYKDTIVTACDNDWKEIAAAKIRNEITEARIDNFREADAFELVSKRNPSEEPKEKFDKIFANYPFGVQIGSFTSSRSFFMAFQEENPKYEINNVTSKDWIFNLLLTQLLNENGKAIGIMTNGSALNQIDAKMRKYFVVNGLIESVITLPEKLFSGAPIGTSLIVLSRGNESGVRLVDATALRSEGRRLNRLTEENIREIVKATKENGEFSKFVTQRELKDKGYVLSFRRYQESEKNDKQGQEKEKKPLEKLLSCPITRGAPFSADQLDKIASSERTDLQYLTLANIRDGLIDSDLPYVTEIENEKYCLKDRCLVMSKNGAPYKIAVAEVPEGKKILANGNLYLIEIDEKQADVYYVAAYLSSKEGTEALRGISAGSVISNISLFQLKGLPIPLPDMETQKAIGERYRATLAKIAALRKKLEDARQELASVVEGGQS